MLKAEMQKKVKSLYPMSESWARKVDKMPQRQLFAIFSKNFWPNGDKKPVFKKRDQIPGQMSMSDFMEV